LSSEVNPSPCESESTSNSPPSLLQDAALPALLVSGASTIFQSTPTNCQVDSRLTVDSLLPAEVDCALTSGCQSGLPLPLTSGLSAGAWLMNEDSAGGGVKSEVRSPGLCEADVALYGEALPYDHMQQYGTGSAASTYVSSSLYNQPYAAYPPAHNTNNRSSCKATPTYLSAYGVSGVGSVPSSGFGSQPSPYAYSSSYAAGYDHNMAQYSGYYATPSYSPYVSSPSSSGSAGHTSYHLGGGLSENECNIPSKRRRVDESDSDSQVTSQNDDSDYWPDSDDNRESPSSMLPSLNDTSPLSPIKAEIHPASRRCRENSGESVARPRQTEHLLVTSSACPRAGHGQGRTV
ncbi:putative eyes absent, partial [Operophtera brumata]